MSELSELIFLESMYRSVGFECPSCKQTNTNKEIPAETQEHIENSCLAFTEIRNRYDLSDDNDIVMFFQEALTQRDTFEEIED